jgi:hypothetical protein
MLSCSWRSHYLLLAELQYTMHVSCSTFKRQPLLPGVPERAMTTCLLLVAARVMALLPGALHSLMRLSVRMWRRPPECTCGSSSSSNAEFQNSSSSWQEPSLADL